MKNLIFCFLIIFCARLIQASPQEEQTPQSGVVLKSEVTLVNLEIVVEKNGKPVTGLKPENFRVELCVANETNGGQQEKQQPKEICEFQKFSSDFRREILPHLFRLFFPLSRL